MSPPRDGDVRALRERLRLARHADTLRDLLAEADALAEQCAVEAPRLFPAARDLRTAAEQRLQAAVARERV
ncbi:MAG: hypothetical protein KGK07_14440 [Chloroflexota bacterium]|nr:hypothetical protein [Chloroflexota bacterium]